MIMMITITVIMSHWIGPCEWFRRSLQVTVETMPGPPSR